MTTVNMTAAEAAAHAAGYRRAANNYAEMLSEHGRDFTPDMGFVVLDRSAALWEGTVVGAPVTLVQEHTNYATLRRLVAEWIVEANTSGGIDADDLMAHLEQAGVGLGAELDRAENGGGDDEEG